MNIRYTEDEIIITAESGMAICKSEECGPTTLTSVRMPKDSTVTYKDCEYGSDEMVEETRYSVRSIIRELKAINKFTAVRTLLETANYDWDFIGSNYLSSDDSDFQTMMAAIVSQGILTQAELDTLLPKCYWEQTAMA